MLCSTVFKFLFFLSFFFFLSYSIVLSSFFYKNISLTLYSRKGWLCVRDELETVTDCYTDPAVLLSHLGWVAQPRVTEGPKPSVCRWFSIGHPVSNCLQLPRAPGYINVYDHPLPLFFCLFTHVRLLINGSVEG